MYMKKNIPADIENAFKPAKVDWTNRDLLFDLSRQIAGDERTVSVSAAKNGKVFGIVAITQNRLIFVGQQKSLFKPGDKTSIDLSHITSVDRSNGQIFSDLIIHTAGMQYRFTSMPSSKVDEMILDIRRGSTQTVQQPTTGVADQLLKLKQLLDAGVLTQEEYDAKAEPLKSSL